MATDVAGDKEGGIGTPKKRARATELQNKLECSWNAITANATEITSQALCGKEIGEDWQEAAPQERCIKNHKGRTMTNA